MIDEEPDLPLFERVKEHVIAAIREGEYPVDSVLPASEDLAARLECSEGTVRRALTDLAQEGMVRRVQRRGTVVARQPSKGRVCLLLGADAHTNLILQQPLYDGLVRDGYEADIVPTASGPDFALEHCRRLLETAGRRAAMVTIEPLQTPKGATYIRDLARSFPRTIAFSFDNHLRMDNAATVSTDHQQAAREVAEHLLRLGHTAVAVHAGFRYDEPSWSGQTARHCRHLLEIAGASYFPLLLGQNEQKDLLHLVRKEKVTAIWALNDHIATSVVSVLHREGIRVPEDVSVIGRHDTPWSRECEPPLTTVSLNPDAIADAVLKLLAQGEDDSAGTQVLVPPLLIERASTAPVSAVGDKSPRRSRRKKAG